MKAKHQRMVIIGLSLISLSFAAYLILTQFRDNLVFFYSPTELATMEPSDQVIRIGGLVKEGSVKKLEKNTTEFILTDLKTEVIVQHQGMLPGLFREEQGMVSKGELNKEGIFMSQELLAKHDENYMPPEVAEALKQSGQWKPDNN